MAETPPPHPLHVLYAEDNPLIADLVCRYLRKQGYFVTHCADGQAAYEKFLESPSLFRIIFTDYDMPKRDGLSLVQAVTSHGYAGVILVNSGSLTREIEREFHALGVSRFVPKPALPSELLRAFREAI